MRRVFIALGLLLPMATLACRQASPTLRHPWPAPSELQPVTLGSETRPAFRILPGSRETVLPNARLEHGEVLLHGAVEKAGSTMEVRIEGSSDSLLGTCRFDSTDWSTCRVRVAHDEGSATMRIRLHGEESSGARLSEPTLLPAAPDPRPPVFVILVDTLRADRLRPWNPEVPLGRSFEALAADSITFSRAYSASSFTRTSVATLFTGLDASTHRVLQRSDALPRSTPTLAAALQAAGWQTKAWSSNPNVLPVFGLDAGFDEFHDAGAENWTRGKTDADEILNAVSADLDQGDAGPVLRYIHLMDPHAPYLPDAEAQAAVLADATLADSFPGIDPTPEALDLYHKYLGEVYDVDAKLGKFFDGLKRRGLYDRSLILVLADHGEEFLDHGALYHGRTLYEEMLRVPVILKAPGNRWARSRIEGEVGLVDLKPTILSVLGVPPSGPTDGVALWSPRTGQWSASSHPQFSRLGLDAADSSAVVQDRRKVIVESPGREQYFDLDRDPFERGDAGEAHPADYAALRAVLDQHAAKDRSGWHIRACGIRLQMALNARLASPVPPSMIDTEAQDEVLAVPGKPESWDIHFDLAVRTVASETWGRITRTEQGDEDEVLLARPASAATIRALGALPLRYALGSAEERQVAPLVNLPADGGSAVVSPTESVACWPANPLPTQTKAPGMASRPPREPYYRIWFVPAPAATEPGRIDPVMHERLRSLGYNR